MKKLFSLIALVVVFQSYQAQEEISGVTPSKTIEVNNEQLKFNGAGLREKWFLDLYVGALYLGNQSKESQNIIEADETMAITLDIVSGLITSQKMINAVDEGFEKSTGGNKEPLKDKIQQFKDSFKEEITKGDHYLIAYIKGTGTEVHKNGQKIKTIEGFEFKKALFGIWLGKEPADDDLKEGMLGK